MATTLADLTPHPVDCLLETIRAGLDAYLRELGIDGLYDLSAGPRPGWIPRPNCARVDIVDGVEAAPRDHEDSGSVHPGLWARWLRIHFEVTVRERRFWRRATRPIEAWLSIHPFLGQSVTNTRFLGVDPDREVVEAKGSEGHKGKLSILALWFSDYRPLEIFDPAEEIEVTS